MAADPRAKMLKLLETLRELDEKRAAIYVEMDALLQGGEGIGAKIAGLKLVFSDTWCIRYGSPYTITNHARVGADLKKFLVAHSADDIAARMLTYIKNDDAFYVKLRHPWEVFAKGFNSFVGLPAPVDVPDTTSKLRAARGQ